MRAFFQAKKFIVYSGAMDWTQEVPQLTGKSGLLVTHCGEFYIFPYCAYAKKKREKNYVTS